MTLQLTLKYRPKQFSDLVGQNHIATVLKSMLRTPDQLPAALLLAGRRGTGKTTTARVIASALNCENPKDCEPCMACGNCLSIQKGNCIFVIEIDAASTGSVDHIRELKETLLYSHSGKCKVIIIDEAHGLSKSAWDALLKTMEEPRPDTLFALATTEPNSIPETIMSRVMQFDFKQITPDMIVVRLQHIINNEGINQLDHRLLRAIAIRAKGSLRDGIMSLEQIRHFAEQPTVQKFHEYYGLVDGDMYVGLTAAARKADIITARTLIKDGFGGGVDMEYFIDSFMRGIGDDIEKRVLSNEEASAMYRIAADVKSKLRVMPSDSAVTFLFVELLGVFHKSNSTGIKQEVATKASVESIFG